MPTLNNIGGKGLLSGCLVVKGSFLVLGVVGIMGIWLAELSGMHVYLWLMCRPKIENIGKMDK